jgi:signal transduction histidine kinase
MERLRLRLRDAQLELRTPPSARGRAAAGLLAVLLLAGSGTALLATFTATRSSRTAALKNSTPAWARSRGPPRGQRQLERLNREMNDVLAVVSHDLKNPLAGIEGLARELRGDDELIDAGQRRIMLEMIEDSARRMFDSSATCWTCSASRPATTDYTPPLRPGAITRVAVQDFQLAARRKSQRIEIEGSPQLWVMGDEAALMRVVNNLVSNALKYAPPCTQVR